MTNAFDPRIVKVGVQINNGAWTYFEDIDIRIQGQRFFSGTSGFFTIKLSNLTRDQRHEFLTSATPILSVGKPANLIVYVGRVSKGTFILFQGQCYTSTVTSPPDISITFRVVDGSALASAIAPNSLGPLTRLSVVSQYVANQLGYNLLFNVTTDINVANVSYPTNTADLVVYLNTLGVRACVNNGNLIVTDQNGINQNNGFVLSQQTGMVGIPQATQDGCTAQMLVQAGINIGDQIGINSAVNPSVNGSYRIDQIAVDIANRDNPFFYNLTLTNRFSGQPIGPQPSGSSGSGSATLQ